MSVYLGNKLVSPQGGITTDPNALQKDFTELTALPQSPATTDLLAIRSGNNTYKVTCQTLASNAIKVWAHDVSPVGIPTSGTDVTLGYPTGYDPDTNRILAVLLEKAWPLQNWNNGAIVVINNMQSYISDNTGDLYLTTTSTQNYSLRFRVLWV